MVGGGLSAGARSSGSKLGKFKVLLDTSAFLLIYEGVDIFDKLWDALKEPIEFYTLDKVVEELKNLAKSRGSRRGRAANLVLTNVIHKVKIIGTGGNYATADDAIVDFVKQNPEFVVVKLDDDLKRRLRNEGAKVLTWWAGRHRFSKG